MDEFEALALAAAAKKRRDKQDAPPETNFREQTMSGVNTGLAQMLGFPVDAMTGVVNAATRGVNRLAGTEIGPIENPVGGSQSLLGALSPTISETQPQTTAQRYGRRIGQEVGQTIPMAGLVAGLPGRLGTMARSNLPQYATTETAGALGAGAAAAGAQDVAPGNNLAEMGAQLAGGMLGSGLAYSASPAPRAPTLDELRTQQKNAYGIVDNSQAQLTPEATDQLRARVTGRAARDSMDPILSPKAARTAEKISSLDTPTISEVEKMRRLSGRVAGNVDPSESELGMGMKQEITDYLNSVQPDQVTGGGVDDVVAALRTGRDATRKIKAHEKITEALQKAENRAATSGTGGNEVNAIRQNLRRILDDPKKRASFTKDEIQGITDIVRGTMSQNALRMLGRFSPTSGFLPASIGLGSSAALGPLGAVPSAIGAGAKGLAEMSTQKAVADLLAHIRNGGAVDPKRLSDAQKAAIAALLGSQTAAAANQ